MLQHGALVYQDRMPEATGASRRHAGGTRHMMLCATGRSDLWKALVVQLNQGHLVVRIGNADQQSISTEALRGRTDQTTAPDDLFMSPAGGLSPPVHPPSLSTNLTSPPRTTLVDQQQTFHHEMSVESSTT